MKNRSCLSAAVLGILAFAATPAVAQTSAPYGPMEEPTTQVGAAEPQETNFRLQAQRPRYQRAVIILMTPDRTPEPLLHLASYDGERAPISFNLTRFSALFPVNANERWETSWHEAEKSALGFTVSFTFGDTGPNE